MVFFHLDCISQIVETGPENEKITCGAKYTYDIGKKKNCGIYMFYHIKSVFVPHRDAGIV